MTSWSLRVRQRVGAPRVDARSQSKTRAVPAAGPRHGVRTLNRAGKSAAGVVFRGAANGRREATFVCERREAASNLSDSLFEPDLGLQVLAIAPKRRHRQWPT